RLRAHEQGEIKENVENSLVCVLGGEYVVLGSHEAILEVQPRCAATELVTMKLALVVDVDLEVVEPFNETRSLDQSCPRGLVEAGNEDVEVLAIDSERLPVARDCDPSQRKDIQVVDGEFANVTGEILGERKQRVPETAL